MFVIVYEGKYWTFEGTLSEDIEQARQYAQRQNAENAKYRLLKARPNFSADLMQIKEIPD